MEEEPEYIGDTMTLIAILVNFKLEDCIKFQWEYSIDGEEWFQLEHTNEQILIIKITQENARYWWRVVVEII